jgi:hypothetical protein
VLACTQNPDDFDLQLTSSLPVGQAFNGTIAQRVHGRCA